MNPMKPVRKVRELELMSVMPSEKGRKEIDRLYRIAAGIPDHERPPVGILGSEMVAAILEFEYPPKS